MTADPYTSYVTFCERIGVTPLPREKWDVFSNSHRDHMMPSGSIPAANSGFHIVRQESRDEWD